MDYLEMYKMTEGEYYKLFCQKKENTPLGLKWKNEMNYWWNKLSPEIKHQLILSAKDDLTKEFSDSFEDNIVT